MSYVIYEKSTTQTLRIIRGGFWQEASYKTLAAAKGAFKKLVKKGTIVSPRKYKIEETTKFRREIEKKVTKRNLLSGKTFETSVNTPACCDPSTETYWSM